MAQPKPESLITALDIGSSKVSALIARTNDGGDLEVLGTGQRESRGVRRGYIADMEGTEAAIREAVEQAETIARTNIDHVWVSFSAGGLISDVASVEVDLGGVQVEQTDIDELLKQGRRSLSPEGRMVLHAQPTLYTLDGLTGVKNPLGLHADRLGVEIHVVAAEPSPVRNLALCVRSAISGSSRSSRRRSLPARRASPRRIARWGSRSSKWAPVSPMSRCSRAGSWSG
jgi:cell division protein FtsA